VALETVQYKLISSAKNFHSFIDLHPPDNLPEVAQRSWLTGSAPVAHVDEPQAFPQEVEVPCDTNNNQPYQNFH